MISFTPNGIMNIDTMPVYIKIGCIIPNDIVNIDIDTISNDIKKNTVFSNDLINNDFVPKDIPSSEL